VELDWRDSQPRRHPGAWPGLRVTVGEASRPGLIVNTCAPYWIRLAANDTPLFWVRIEDGRYGYEILRSHENRPVGVIPPISFELVEQRSRDGGVAARDRAWAQLFADGLAESGVSPLSAGSWHLGYFGPKFDTRELPAALVHKIVGQQSYGRINWDSRRVYPITLRDMSPRDSGPVKAWRKCARTGSLPPVLLYGVSGLAAHVVLDGHDRLLAASLEDVSVSALSLEVAPKKWVPGHTRARPLAGGVNQWASEVSRELTVQGIAKTGLLDGLEEKPD
jgi:hypothetical protein